MALPALAGLIKLAAEIADGTTWSQWAPTYVLTDPAEGGWTITAPILKENPSAHERMEERLLLNRIRESAKACNAEFPPEIADSIELRIIIRAVEKRHEIEPQKNSGRRRARRVEIASVVGQAMKRNGIPVFRGLPTALSILETLLIAEAEAKAAAERRGDRGPAKEEDRSLVMASCLIQRDSNAKRTAPMNRINVGTRQASEARAVLVRRALLACLAAGVRPRSVTFRNDSASSSISAYGMRSELAALHEEIFPLIRDRFPKGTPGVPKKKRTQAP